MFAKDNPFKSGNIDNIEYKFVNSSWDQILANLYALNFRAAVTGNYGTGKTTFIIELSKILKDKGFVVKQFFLNRQDVRSSEHELVSIVLKSDKNTIIIVDGADLLGELNWFFVKFLSLRNKGLIIAGHKKRMLAELHVCKTNHEVMSYALKSVWSDCPSIIKEKAIELFNINNGNIRNVFMELYDYCARTKELLC